MKRIIYTLLAATIVFSACQKENRMAPVAGDQSISITDADFTASKASYGENKKNSQYGLELDYDLVIKEVSDDKYKVAIKVHGLKVNGQKMDEEKNKAFKSAIFGAVLTLNNTKEKQEIPLNLKLTSTGVNGNTYNFPEFTYKGDLSYELVNVNASIIIGGGNVVVTGAASIDFCDSKMTITGGNLQMKDNGGFTIKEGTEVTINAAKTETNFAILLTGKGDKCNVDDDDDWFLLPKGHSVEQDPKVAKVTFPKGEDGSKVMRITVKGDPAENVASVYYTPAPIPDPNNPGSTIQPAAIEFHKSEPSEKKIGICCYDRCLEPKDNLLCGTTIHLKPADFNNFGEGWARITLKTEL